MSRRAKHSWRSHYVSTPWPQFFSAGLIRLSALCLAGVASPVALSQDGSQWQFAGHDRGNTRFAWYERTLRPGNVGRLAKSWTFVAEGEVTATPAVEYGMVYFPDKAGNLYKVNATTGALVWRRNIANYTGTAAKFGAVRPISRTTPAISGWRMVVGTRDGWILGIDKYNGNLLWKTKADWHAATMITASPVVDNGKVYAGVSSGEEYWATRSDYTCCSFRGSVIALNLSNGAILWRTRTVPSGYSGGSVWSSTPAIDRKRNSLYVTTGNNYTVPATVQSCVNNAGSNTSAIMQCYSKSNWFNSMLSLDLTTGRIKWGRRTSVYDTWTVGCGVPESNIPRTGNCQSPSSPDYDFASGVNLFTALRNGSPVRDLVGAGRKNGVYYAFNPDNGATVWARRVGPGGAAGGIQWGSATDGTRIYIGVSNSGRKAYKLYPSNETIYWGAWSALNAETGAILWQKGNPATTNGRAEGPVSVANGIVFGGSYDPSGYYYAFSARNGSILWRFPSGGSTISGAAIVNGMVFWGSGYDSGPGTFNNRLHAFKLP